MTEHVWATDEEGADGEADIFAYDTEDESTGHNGPECVVCGFFFCMHCYDAGWQHPCPGPPPEGAVFTWAGTLTEPLRDPIVVRVGGQTA